MVLSLASFFLLHWLLWCCSCLAAALAMLPFSGLLAPLLLHLLGSQYQPTHVPDPVEATQAFDPLSSYLAVVFVQCWTILHDVLFHAHSQCSLGVQKRSWEGETKAHFPRKTEAVRWSSNQCTIRTIPFYVSGVDVYLFAHAEVLSTSSRQ